jgi:hypothetical protein
VTAEDSLDGKGRQVLSKATPRTEMVAGREKQERRPALFFSYPQNDLSAPVAGLESLVCLSNLV